MLHIPTTHDFIGNPIAVGSFLATAGGGNVKAEYGMLLYLVTSTAGGKLQATRLNAVYKHAQDASMREHLSRYTQGKRMLKLLDVGILADDESVLVHPSTSTITNTNRYVVVTPPDHVQAAFRHYALQEIRGAATVTPQQVASWIHGGSQSPFVK
jgi:hypothetical protein